MASDLITLTDFATATGTSESEMEADKQAQVTWAISVASEAVRQYLDRDITLKTDATAGPRTFRYYGHGIVEIDDCTAITEVDTAITPWSPASRTLDPTEYVPGATSSNLPVFDYIELWTNLPFLNSPEMGFQRNQDRYGFRPHPVELSVTADWGWDKIPMGIQMATVWTVAEVISDPSPYISESISGYSRSTMPSRQGSGGQMSAPNQAGGGQGFMQTLVPERAQSALDPYLRVNV